jgi:hypothetical protein
MAACRIREFGVWLLSAGAYHVAENGYIVHTVLAGCSVCAAVLVVLPYLLGDCATPGGGIHRRLALQRRLCLDLTIASMQLGSVLGLTGPLSLTV